MSANDPTPSTDATKRKSFPVVWLFLLIAVVIAWWFLRGQCATDSTAATPSAEAAALAAGADPDDILVDLKDDATPAQIERIERELGIDLVLVSNESLDEQFYKAHVDAAKAGAILAALGTRPEVELAEHDAQVTLSPMEVVVAPPSTADAGFPNDPKYRHQWHLKQIGMPEAWKLADGNGTVVAVIDTGVAYENFQKFHLVEDLAGIQFVDGYDFVNNKAHGNDDHGHGTHVAGTIAQATNNGIGVAGVARNVKIMPLKVLSASGSGSVGGIADAIRFAADKGAKVINMSLGGPFPSRALKNACEYAHKKGVVIVAAAGNESRSRVGYPAGYPGVIAVSATRFDETTTFYSNWGKDVDIAGPGGDTRVDQDGDGLPDGVLQNTIAIGDPTKSDYFGYMGTSMASPHVAGVAALVVGEGVTDPVEVETILTSTARKPKHGNYERDRYGAGIVDAPAAIRAAQAQRKDVQTATVESAPSDAGWPVAGGLGRIALGLVIAGAVAASVRRRLPLNVTFVAGAIAGAAAPFSLAWALPSVASLPVVGSLLLATALVPMGLLVLGYGAPRLRPLLAGVAAGFAAHLAFGAFAATDVLWMAGNAIACVGLARLTLRR
jgi:serine protease